MQDPVASKVGDEEVISIEDLTTWNMAGWRYIAHVDATHVRVRKTGIEVK